MSSTLGHDLLGALQAGAVGQLRVHDQIALVLLGNEADGHAHEAEVGQAIRPP